MFTVLTSTGKLINTSLKIIVTACKSRENSGLQGREWGSGFIGSPAVSQFTYRHTSEILQVGFQTTTVK